MNARFLFICVITALLPSLTNAQTQRLGLDLTYSCDLSIRRPMGITRHHMFYESWEEGRRSVIDIKDTPVKLRLANSYEDWTANVNVFDGIEKSLPQMSNYPFYFFIRSVTSPETGDLTVEISMQIYNKFTESKTAPVAEASAPLGQAITLNYTNSERPLQFRFYCRP